jgi:hypothetical protein
MINLRTKQTKTLSQIKNDYILVNYDVLSDIKDKPFPHISNVTIDIPISIMNLLPFELVLKEVGEQNEVFFFFL